MSASASAAAPAAGSGGPLLRIRNLTVDLRAHGEVVHAVRDVSLDVDRGEIVALVGESGSGKSVTASAVLQLLPEGATVGGSVLFDGRELTALGPGGIRSVRGSEIAMVFQDPMTSLNPVYTIGEHLHQALCAHGRIEGDVRERSVELLDSVGMPRAAERLRAYPHELSGGQRQRAMIAMALAGSPRLLIADEPTTALDVTVQAGILDLLDRLVRERDMALLLITHDMGVVARMAHRVTVVRDGVNVESDTAGALFARPRDAYTRELLDAVPRIGAFSRPAAAAARSRVLEAEGVTVVYRTGPLKRVSAVSDASLLVHERETVAIVGESGSGKSSLGKAIVGLAPIASGRVVIDGTPLRNGAKAGGRARAATSVAIVFQDPSSSLNPRATIGQSITAPLRWHGVAKARAELRRRGEEMLERVRLPREWLDRYPHQLSGGQRQRVGIARALILRPKLLIADEPTSALDVSVQATVLDLLEDLQEEFGFGCLFISHDLAVVGRLADRVVVMRNGEIVEQGETSLLLTDPEVEYTKRLISAVPVPDPAFYARG